MENVGEERGISLSNHMVVGQAMKVPSHPLLWFEVGESFIWLEPFPILGEETLLGLKILPRRILVNGRRNKEGLMALEE